MEDILLVHRKSNHKAFEHGAVWKTCLRQVLITNEQEYSTHEVLDDDLVLTGAEAFNYLIEVLCGLHSPIVGETEVLGQFRLFVESRKNLGDSAFFENQKWLQFVFSEVKRIRTEHLVGVGSHSYGSLLRRYCKENDDITVLGAGHLAGEILPWLAHKKNLQVITRSPDKALPFKNKIPQLEVNTFKNKSILGEVVIIAAPVSDEWIVEQVTSSENKVKTIYDLRGEENQLENLLKGHTDVLPLYEFFKTLEHHKIELQQKIQQIQDIIRERSLAFVNRIELRPHGWDDICA